MTQVQSDTGHKITISPSAKGAVSEHIATAWLLQQGYDVFRNVAPNGRADLLAVNWDENSTIRVDVKSQEFSLTATGPRADEARRMDERNDGFEIKYLVVKNDGSCGWYVRNPKEANDNKSQEWWLDKKSGQRLKMPGHPMSKKEWSFLCHWVMKNCPEHITPFDKHFVDSIRLRGIGYGEVYISAEEFVVLEKFRLHLFDKLLDGNSDDREAA